MRDFEKVLLRARPTVSQKDLKVFEDFTAEFGEEGELRDSSPLSCLLCCREYMCSALCALTHIPSGHPFGHSPPHVILLFCAYHMQVEVCFAICICKAG